MQLKKAGGNEEQRRAAEAAKLLNSPKTKASLKVLSELLKKLPEGVTEEEVLKAAGFDISNVTKQSSGEYVQQFTLHSGKVASFIEMFIPYEDLDTLVVVDDINGREQERLDEDSLSDILVSIGANQFVPVFGSMREDNRINLGDGSRRKAAAKILRTGLKALVSLEPIDSMDLRILAMQIQSAKEHSLYELGRKWLGFANEGYEGKDIAKIVGKSPATISRGLKAARIPTQLLVPIDELRNLTHDDWDFLDTLHDLIRANYEAKDNSHDYAFAEFSKGALGETYQKFSLPASKVIDCYKKHAKSTFDGGESAPKNEPAPVAPKKKERLSSGNGKFYLDKKQTTRGDVTYSLGKLPERVCLEIEDFIKAKLAEHTDAEQ